MEDNNIEKRIEKFLATEKVYHYTSFEAALNIIISNQLRFGMLRKMNDCNEVYHRFLLPEDTKTTWRDVEKEMSKYKQLSFSKDNVPRCGYDIPAMWGHYANKGYGACLVFDKSKIMDRLESDMVEQDVMYIEHFDESISVEDVQGFFEKHKKEIFFKKTKDWSYEQEWRILVRSEQEETYLPFGDSLMAIIMNFAPDIDCGDCVFNSNNAKIFKKVAPDNIPILHYALFLSDLTLSDGKNNDWSKNKDEQKKYEVAF